MSNSGEAYDKMSQEQDAANSAKAAINDYKAKSANVIEAAKTKILELEFPSVIIIVTDELSGDVRSFWNEQNIPAVIGKLEMCKHAVLSSETSGAPLNGLNGKAQQ